MEQATHFRYLRSEITVSGDATIEISARISRAQSAFLLLSRCLWLRPDISISTKCHVYTAAVRSILLYGCETCRCVVKTYIDLLFSSIIGDVDWSSRWKPSLLSIDGLGLGMFCGCFQKGLPKELS